MRLTRSNLHHYLLHHGLVTHQSIIEGNFCVVEVPRRNFDFKVIHKGRAGRFVKQIRNYDAVATQTLQREFVCYRLAGKLDRLRFIVPKLLHYDPQEHILVTELIENGESLHAFAYRTETFPPEIGRTMGVTLARCHQCTTADLGECASIFPKRPPAIFCLREMAAWLLPPLSRARTEMNSILSDFPDFERRLSGIRDSWRAQCLIHSDIRWDNWVVRRDGALSADPPLTLVDWEMADIGDPCWDIGAVFQSFLALWIDKLPFATGAPPHVLVELTRSPLESMQSAIREFWRAYQEALALDEQAASKALDLSARYCAARLAQTALEYMASSSRMSPSTLSMLQASLNILNDPGALEDLLGLRATA